MTSPPNLYIPLNPNNRKRSLGYLGKGIKLFQLERLDVAKQDKNVFEGKDSTSTPVLERTPDQMTKNAITQDDK
jgi:hypothetical protein